MNIQATPAQTPAEAAFGLTLPNKRVESFHYTDLKNALGEFKSAAEKPSDESAVSLGGNFPRLAPNASVIHFYDGFRFDKDEAMPQGVSVSYDLPACPKADGIDDTLVSINDKLTGEGLFLTVDADAKVETPVGLAHALSGSAGTSASTRFEIKAGKNSSSQFIERVMGSSKEQHLSSSLVSLHLEEGAELEYFLVQQTGLGGEHLGRINVVLEKDAKLTLFILNAGGKLVRQEVKVGVCGEKSHLDMKGVNLVGDNAHIDVTTVLEHKVPNTTAEELFRNVVTGDGHGVFQGQIKVNQIAQKTDAKMACNTLLLTDESNFSAKPELEIFADDVLCGHGATVTDIDEDHMFYLRARGISEKQARALLIKGFVDEVVEELDAGELGDNLTQIIDTWLDLNV